MKLPKCYNHKYLTNIYGVFLRCYKQDAFSIEFGINIYFSVEIYRCMYKWIYLIKLINVANMGKIVKSQMELRNRFIFSLSYNPPPPPPSL